MCSFFVRAQVPPRPMSIEDHLDLASIPRIVQVVDRRVSFLERDVFVSHADRAMFAVETMEELWMVQRSLHSEVEDGNFASLAQHQSHNEHRLGPGCRQSTVSAKRRHRFPDWHSCSDPVASCFLCKRVLCRWISIWRLVECSGGLVDGNQWDLARIVLVVRRAYLRWHVDFVWK